MTDLEMMELAIRRVADRLKSQVPWDMAVTEALDMLADEIAEGGRFREKALSKITG